MKMRSLPQVRGPFGESVLRVGGSWLKSVKPPPAALDCYQFAQCICRKAAQFIFRSVFQNQLNGGAQAFFVIVLNHRCAFIPARK